MLQWLRDNLKSFAWTLWLVIIAFILFYVPDFISSAETAGAAAVVGDEQVSEREFQRAYRAVEDQYRNTPQFDADLLRQLGIPMRVLNGLINDKILLAEAKRLGLTVSDEELRAAILEFGDGQGGYVFRGADGRFIGDELYTRLIQANGYASAADFESRVREDMLLAELRSLMAENLYLSDAEIEERYRQETERAKIRYLRLPAERYAAEVEVGPQEVAARYEERREEYRRPEQRVVSYLLVDVNQLRSTIEPTDEELRRYYDENLDEFTQQEQVQTRHILLRPDGEGGDEGARQRLAELRQRIERGEDFAELAREHSADRGSAEQGGDLGFQARGSFVPEYEEAAFAAAKGELVGPFKTVHGYHLLEVLDRREGGARPFESLREVIRFRLVSERARDRSEQLANELKTEIDAAGTTADDTLSALAEGRPELSFETSPPFAEQDPVGTLGRVPGLNEAAFALAEGEVSDPVRVGRGWAILRLDEVREPAVPPLEEVEAEVRAALAGERQQELARRRLEELRAEIASGATTLAAAAEEIGVAVEESAEFGYGEPVQGLAAGAATAAAALAMEVGEVGGPIVDRDGALLFEVTERQEVEMERFAAEKDQLRERMQQESTEQLVAALVTRRRQELNVELGSNWLASYGGENDAAGS